MIGILLFFIFIVAVLWKGWEVALASMHKAEHSGSLWNPPVYGIKISVGIGALLMFLQGLARLVVDLYVAITGGKPE